MAVIVLIVALTSGRSRESTLDARLDQYVQEPADNLSDQEIEQEAKRLSRLAEHLGFDIPLAELDRPEAAAAQFEWALPVLPHPLAAAVTPGRPQSANGVCVLDHTVPPSSLMSPSAMCGSIGECATYAVR